MRPYRWLFWLALLAVLGYGGWRAALWGQAAWQASGEQSATVARLDAEVRVLRARAEELNRREVDLSLAQQKGGADLAALGARVDASEQKLLNLGDAVEGGRTRLSLAAVEQLLLAAADRLQLAHDNAGALATLDLADQRLASLNDPRLYRVREALSAERHALAAAGVPDVAGASITINELLRAAPRLALMGRAPEHYEVPESPPAVPEDGTRLSRAWAAVKNALSHVFALHRRDGPQPRWLPPDQQALVAQVLQLKLEGARLALLARDGRTLHELADGARDWVARYYDVTDPDVKAALAQLDALRSMNLSPPVPEIGRSLALLRGVLGMR